MSEMDIPQAAIEAAAAAGFGLSLEEFRTLPPESRDNWLDTAEAALRAAVEQVGEVEDLTWSVRKVLNGSPHDPVFRFVGSDR